MSHQYVFEKGLFQLSGGTSCLFTTLIWQVIERVHVVYSSWFSWRYEPLLRFGIGGPRFYPRVAVTMISKCFVKLGTFVYYRKHEVKMTRILCKFIIYPSCERALKNGRVKSKIVRKSSFGGIMFLTSHDYFSSAFCILPKKVLLLKYRKWVSHLKNCYHYANVVENARINFSSSPYYTLLFYRKENFKLFEVALSAVLCNDAVGCIMKYWNTVNTTLEIYLLFENGHKSTQTRCKFFSNLTKCTKTIDFCLTSVFFINLENLSYSTLVVLFILWKGKCWLKVRRKLFVKIIQWC